MKAPVQTNEERTRATRARDPQDTGQRHRPDATDAAGDRDAVARPARLRSLDAVRGLAIVVMLLAGNPFPRTDMLAHLKHPEWHGLTFADLFFPLFLFAMGISMTLSRRAASPRLVLRRVVLLVLLGIFLTSLKHEGLVIAGVLQHIAGAYLVAWLVLKAPRRIQLPLATAIVGGVWLGFVLWAGAGQDPWGQRDTFAHAVNGWFLGGFSTEGVLQTFISSVTVLGGAFIGRAMKGKDPQRLAVWLAGHGSWLVPLGLVMALWVPINKRLWSPSFTILTIGTSCAWLALFVWLGDMRRQRWIVPLEHLGANPIAIYVIFMTARALLDDYRGIWPQVVIGGSHALVTLMYGFLWVTLAVLLGRFLYNRRVFFKI